MTSTPSRARLAVLGVVAAAFVLLPLRNILFGVYSWHIRQPEFTQGGLELAVVFALFTAVIAAFGTNTGTVLVISIVAALYLQLHSMLIASLLGLFFVEGLLQFGKWLERRVGLGALATPDLQGHVTSFVVGMAGWTLLAVIVSALGFGTLRDLRFLALGIALLGLTTGPRTPLVATIVALFRRASRREGAVMAFLLVLLLTQFAKAAVAVDYDSGWYGVRPERVLIGTRSFFDDLRLAHWVYYYPKQFELLTAPLCGLARHGFQMAMNVVVLGVAFVAIYRLARENEMARLPALCVVAIIGTIPAVANMASTAKSDNLAHCLAFVAILHLWRWSRGARGDDLVFGLVALLGMLGTKVTMYAYVPLIGAGFAAVAAARAHRSGHPGAPFASLTRLLPYRGPRAAGHAVVLAIAALALTGLLLRTYVLTGVPTVPFLLGLWRRIGFQPRYPWSLLQFPEATGFSGGLASLGRYWYKLLFDPNGFVHYEMAWPGNLGAFGAVAVLLLARRETFSRDRIAFAVATIPVLVGGLVVAVLIPRHAHGGSDGNYYVVPVVLAFLAAAFVLLRGEARLGRATAWIGLAFVVGQLPIMFVSHWSWHYGTAPFRLDLGRSFAGEPDDSAAILRNAGVLEIDAYLRSRPSLRRCIGFSRASAAGSEQALRRLSCNYEDFEQMGRTFPAIFATEDSFETYLAWARPELLIAPVSFFASADRDDRTPARRIFRAIACRADVVKIVAATYVALDVSSAACIATRTCMRGVPIVQPASSPVPLRNRTRPGDVAGIDASYGGAR